MISNEEDSLTENSGKEKVKKKMVGINTIIIIITFNLSDLNDKIKRQSCQTGLKENEIQLFAFSRRHISDSKIQIR